MTFFQNFDLVNIKENSKNGYGIMKIIQCFYENNMLNTYSLAYFDYKLLNKLYFRFNNLQI